MPSEIASLYLDLTARTAQFNAAMTEAQARADATEGSMGGLAGSAAKLSVAFVAVGAAAAVWAVDGAAQLDQSLIRVQTQAGATSENLGTIKQALYAMAPAVGQGPDALAQSLYHVESAGFRGAQALDMVQAAANLANVGGANLEDTTQAIVGTMAAFASTGMTASQAIGTLNAIVGTGDMRMEQLDKAIATGILPTAKMFGLSLTDVGAALATLTDNVTPADEAATRLKMTITMMGAPTLVAQKSFAALGLNWNTLADDMRKPNGLLLAVTDLKDHLSHIDASQLKGGLGAAEAEMAHFGMTTEQINQAVGKLGPTATEQALLVARAFGGGKSSAVMMTLLSEYDRFASKFPQIAAASGNMTADIAAQNDTLTQKEHDFAAAVQVSRDKLGDLLTPGAKQALGWLADTALPDINKGIDWLGTTGAQDAQKGFDWIQKNAVPPIEHLVHGVEDLGGQAGALGSALEPVAAALGGGILEGAKFLADHEGILVALVDVWAVRWATIKGLGMASEILSWASAFRTFAAQEGTVKALTSALGMGGTQGLSGALRGITGDVRAFEAAGSKGDAAAALGKALSGLGFAASDAKAGLAGAAPALEGMGTSAAEAALGASALVPVVGALAVGAGLLVAANWNDISAGINKVHDAIWGPDWVAADQNLHNLVDDYSKFKIAADQAGTSADQFEAAMSGQAKAMAAVAKSNPLIAGDSNFQNAMSDAQNLSADYAAMDQVSKTTFADLVQTNKQAANTFAVTWAQNGHNAVGALEEVRKEYPLLGDAVTQLSADATRAQDAQALDAIRNAETQRMATVTTANQQISVIQNAFGMSKAAATAYYLSLNPQNAALLNQQNQIALAFGTTTDNIYAMEQAGIIASNGILTAFGNIDAGIALTASDIQQLNAAIIAASSGADQGNGKLGGHHAAGGPMAAGQVSVVNEHGPEVWQGSDGTQYMMAPGDGKVIPSVNTPGGGAQVASGGGGGGDIIITGSINITGVQDLDSLQKALRDYALQRARSSGRTKVWQ